MLNEAQLKAAHEDRKNVLDQLEKGLYPDSRVPRAYVVDVKNAAATAIGGFTSADGLTERSMGTVVLRAAATVEQKTVFYCKSIQCTVLVKAEIIASGASPAGPGVFGLPGKLRLGCMEEAGFETGNQFPSLNFWWKVRDTGSDREWQDNWLPAALLQSGDCLPLMAGRGHSAVTGGSELEVQIQPVTLLGGGLNDFLNNIRDWTFHFTFHGEERRL